MTVMAYSDEVDDQYLVVDVIAARHRGRIARINHPSRRVMVGKASETRRFGIAKKSK